MATKRIRNEIRVVAAVMQKNGKILICQRKKTDRHPLKWEFPGGKVELDEEPRPALARELSEELDVTATIGEEIVRYEHQYPGRVPIVLMFYRVEQWTGDLRNVIFEQMKWVSPKRLPSFDFLEGDIDFVRRLASGEY